MHNAPCVHALLAHVPMWNVPMSVSHIVHLHDKDIERPKQHKSRVQAIFSLSQSIHSDVELG